MREVLFFCDATGVVYRLTSLDSRGTNTSWLRDTTLTSPWHWELSQLPSIEASGDDEIHHEAVVEHHGAKKLSAEIEASAPKDGTTTPK